MSLPALAGFARSTGLAAWWRVRRDYRALQPLWRDLTAAVPDAALNPNSSRWKAELAVRHLDYLLYRRIIELRDCVLALHSPAAPSSPRGETHGRVDHPEHSTVSARLLQVAASASQLEPHDDIPGDRAASTTGLAAELQTFLALGRAYRNDAQPASDAG